MVLKRALQEQKLRENTAIAMRALSEARYRTLVENAPEAIVVFDMDEQRFTEVNEQAEKLFGYSRKELLTMGPVELSPEYQPDGTKSIESAVSLIEGALAGQIPVFDWIHRNRAGEEIPCEIRLVLMPSAGRRHIRASVTDVRQKKKAEAALRLSEERNRDLVEHSSNGICRVSFEGAFLDSNPSLLRILGCEAFAQLKKLNLFRDVFRFPEQQAKLFQTCAHAGQVREAEAEWRRVDGGFVSVRLQLRLLKRKEAAQEFELIAEDTTELRAMERQLLQAQKFEAIGQLAGGVAHDFNNVVGAILGWAEIGYDQTSGMPEIADRFARIREQGERAAALTRELLAFARRQVLQPRLMDLNAVASGLMNFLDRVIGKDIELKMQTVSLDPIKADPTQIEQVIMNLCLNARDAMPSGGRLVIETEMVELDDAYCRFYPHVLPGRYAVLSVSDTGMGMDAETKDRIFEPFFTTKAPGKGTGMGLASVYGIVKQHGGFAHVYSEIGQGTLFRVYLPLTTSGEVAAAHTLAPLANGQQFRGSELVLIAEDHESIREMARHTLLNLGYRVLSAADGEEALQLVERERPALAVLDVVMPKMGGQATLARLLERFPGLPVIFTSGYSHDATGLPASRPEMTYLQKPYSPTALGKLVRQVLDHA
jgi:two-component system, cell cycle sensor histidine kinase and response regulator CckA